MQWALVIYSLVYLHADGRPMVTTMHPEYNEAACRAAELQSRNELRQAGFFGLCQHFPKQTTPVWPWRPTFRPEGMPYRLTEHRYPR